MQAAQWVRDGKRDAIVDGTFAPGEQLRDLELTAWLGVSRTPVREALLRLAQAGLVVAQPGRSTTVSSLDRRAVRDARGVVAAMHEVAVREAVARLTDADLEAMREANRRFGSALEQGDVEAALRADDELHGVPVAVAANRALTAVLDQFTPVLRRAERLRFSSVEARRRSRSTMSSFGSAPPAKPIGRRRSPSTRSTACRPPTGDDCLPRNARSAGLTRSRHR